MPLNFFSNSAILVSIITLKRVVNSSSLTSRIELRALKTSEHVDLVRIVSLVSYVDLNFSVPGLKGRYQSFSWSAWFSRRPYLPPFFFYYYYFLNINVFKKTFKSRDFHDSNF